MKSLENNVFLGDFLMVYCGVLWGEVFTFQLGLIITQLGGHGHLSHRSQTVNNTFFIGNNYDFFPKGILYDLLSELMTTLLFFLLL